MKIEILYLDKFKFEFEEKLFTIYLERLKKISKNQFSQINTLKISHKKNENVKSLNPYKPQRSLYILSNQLNQRKIHDDNNDDDNSDHNDDDDAADDNTNTTNNDI